jgi:hypothetical protein
MISFKIGDVYANAISDWSEMTLSQGIALHEIAFKFPKAIPEMYELALQSNKQAEILELEATLTDTERIKAIPQLYGEVIALLTDLPPKLIRKMPSAVRVKFYNDYLLDFVLGVLFFPHDWNYAPIESFKFNGTTYLLPKGRVLNIGTSEFHEPFANGTAIEFTEVADFEIAAKGLAGGRFAMAANIVSILCRPEGEAYNENTSLARVPIFMELSMDVVWNVFFCIIEYFNTQKGYMATFLTELKTQKGMLQL